MIFSLRHNFVVIVNMISFLTIKVRSWEFQINYPPCTSPQFKNPCIKGRCLKIPPLVSFINQCCCQVVWQKWINQISIFLFHISINLFRSWHTFIKNKLIRISLFLMIVCQLRNKFMLLVRNKNILIWYIHFCQTTWQQQKPHFFLVKP